MQFKRIETGSEAQQQVWKLYVNSFPDYERRGIEAHINALADCLFYANEIYVDYKVIGLLFYWKFSNYIFIEHFAIDESLRGKNYGSLVLQKFISDNDDLLLILEIEPPIDDISNRRLRFYEKLGFKMNDYYYEHPSFSSINPHVHELKLMSYPRYITKDELIVFRENMRDRVLLYID